MRHSQPKFGFLRLPSDERVNAFVLGERLVARPGSAEPLRLEAEGRQWQWTFRYPEAGGLVTVDTLHIPAGREIAFTVTSADVIHSFWVPRLGGKIDAVPGHRNTIRLRADRPGRYGGACAEFCGIGHTAMRFTVVAHPAADYDAALRLNPDMANAYKNRGLLWEKQANKQAAIADLQRYLDLGGGKRNGDQSVVEAHIRRLKGK